MPKITAPILSLDASGTIGGIITYSHWKGIKYAKKQADPQNPKSEKQILNRNLFSSLVSQYHNTPWLTTTPPPFPFSWSFFPILYKKTMTGLNYFLNYFLTKSSQPPSPISNMAISINGQSEITSIQASTTFPNTAFSVVVLSPNGVFLSPPYSGTTDGEGGILFNEPSPWNPPTSYIFLKIDTDLAKSISIAFFYTHVSN